VKFSLDFFIAAIRELLRAMHAVSAKQLVREMRAER
jgi:hypothetical protein